jgi:hypothetical protein
MIKVINYIKKRLPFGCSDGASVEANEAGQVPNEILRLLVSIDNRLATLESTVRPRHRHASQAHIVTGHWND